MNIIDLHVHSSKSDGSFTPTELVNYAIEKGLSAFALTDHDTTAGIQEARQAAARAGIELVPGIEFSCVYQDTEIHILGLFIREEDPALSLGIQKLRDIRRKRNEEMLSRFQADRMPITLEELRDGNPNAAITRAHFARVLVKKGYASSLNQAFSRTYSTAGATASARKRLPRNKSWGFCAKTAPFPPWLISCSISLAGRRMNG